MAEDKYCTLFIGYEMPVCLDVKHSEALPMLDQHFTRVDLEDDIVHVVPESKINIAEDIIYKLNEKHQCNMTCDFEDFSDERSLEN